MTRIQNRLNFYEDYTFTIVFDESLQKIESIDTPYSYHYLRYSSRTLYKSLNLNDHKQLCSLKELRLHRTFSGFNQTVSDFNGWSDVLQDVHLTDNNSTGSVSFTGFPKKLRMIFLHNNNLNGKL